MPNGEPVDAPNMVAELISRKRRGLELAEQIIDEDYKQGLETQSQDVIEGLQLLQSEVSGSRADCVQPGLGQARRVKPAVLEPKGIELPDGGSSSMRPSLASGPTRITATNGVPKRKRREDEDEPPRKRLGVTLSTSPRSVVADALVVSEADMSEVTNGGNIQPTVAAVQRKRIPRFRPKLRGVPQLRDAVPVVLANARQRLSELKALMALPQMSGQREATFKRMELQTLILSLEKIYTYFVSGRTCGSVWAVRGWGPDVRIIKPNWARF
ncbi:hypothetical protein BZA05DRAFT_449218 [Tricharina praecox]|uniref:uncharacterized protein n=1 Tax=Tricharina praecox TaxID=43433 RepID=UPI00221F754B|nr:uncharacterized protein BZA05DRAFT_449218 [Tricharina praecox]KAI5842224.1 hypothetical protein BZA05DRAFT_449218 [Tricharina praecox]